MFARYSIHSMLQTRIRSLSARSLRTVARYCFASESPTAQLATTTPCDGVSGEAPVTRQWQSGRRLV